MFNIAVHMPYWDKASVLQKMRNLFAVQIPHLVVDLQYRCMDPASNRSRSDETSQSVWIRHLLFMCVAQPLSTSYVCEYQKKPFRVAHYLQVTQIGMERSGKSVPTLQLNGAEVQEASVIWTAVSYILKGFCQPTWWFCMIMFSRKVVWICDLLCIGYGFRHSGLLNNGEALAPLWRKVDQINTAAVAGRKGVRGRGEWWCNHSASFVRFSSVALPKWRSFTTAKNCRPTSYWDSIPRNGNLGS